MKVTVNHWFNPKGLTHFYNISVYDKKMRVLFPYSHVGKEPMPKSDLRRAIKCSKKFFKEKRDAECEEIKQGPKYGKGIFHYYEHAKAYLCPCCHILFNVQCTGKANYCPNCGIESLEQSLKKS